MNVAMVTPFPDLAGRVSGGVAGAAKYLVDELVKDPDVRLTIVVPQGGAARAGREQWGTVAVHRLAREGFWKFLPGTLYDLVAGRRQVRRFVRGLDADLAHFQGTTFLASGWPGRAVLTIHGIAEQDALWDGRTAPLRSFKRVVLKLTEDHGRRRARNLILISESVKRFLPEDARRKLWRIANPVPDAFFETAWMPEPGRAFCCARLAPLKNILGLIAAFGLVANKGAARRLRIAGAGEPAYRTACERLAERVGLGSRVSFLGGLGTEEVRRELARASCFVTASFQETAPLSVSEAMAVGVPVVASAVGGLPEMVADRRSGFLVDPRDARDIRDALERVLSDRSLARSMGREGKALARARHGASGVAEKTMRVYREIARRA